MGYYEKVIYTVLLAVIAVIVTIIIYNGFKIMEQNTQCKQQLSMQRRDLSVAEIKELCE